MSQLIDIFLHLDVHLAELSMAMGPWLYLVLFLIVFAETGLVVTPFLPGDSLLFATGALCAIPEAGLSVHAMVALLIVAGILGDGVNYAVGYLVGPKVFTSDTGLFLNKKHLLKTEEFYHRHGPFTIVIARFVPIVRTFAPFVAGIGKMAYRKFAAYNVLGAVAWVVSFTYGGYWFGNVPAVKRNFHLVILGIIVVSILPMVFEWFRHRRQKIA